jgi:hypothetical protein
VEENNMDIWDSLPPELQDMKIDLSSLGSHSFAWPKDAALNVVDELCKRNLPILGGDVYRLCDEIITPTYDNWYCQKRNDEDGLAYVARSCRESKEYIMQYPRPDVIFDIVPGQLWHIV